MFRADAHFRMGSAHEAEGSPCQDYALSENEMMPFAALSDGCSSSGKTDLGARLWCLTARQLRLFSATASNYSSLIKPMIVDTANRLGLVDADLDATLGLIFLLRNGGIRSLLWGDGVMAARTPRGTEIMTVEWSGNMPGYLSYELSINRCAEFIRQSEALAEGAAPCRVTYTTIKDDGTVDTWRDGYHADVALRGMQANWPPGTEIAAIMSDGVSQVSGLTTQEVVTELLSIGPARQGAFARRRLQAALKKFAKDGHKPIDDISFAALVRVDDV